jgi:hypothetical protein
MRIDTRPLAGNFDLPEVAGWEREAPRVLGDGYVLGYNLRARPGPIKITICVYRDGAASVPSGHHSDAVEQRLQSAVNTVLWFASRGEHYRFAEVRSHILQALGAFPGAPVAHRVVLEVVELDNPLIPKLRSLLMTAANDHFVKIMITQPADSSEQEEAALLALLEAIGRALIVH